MWKFLAASLLLVTPAFAQENGTAYDALRVVGSTLGRASVNHIISVTGVHGNPQPASWKVLLDDRHAPGGVREVVVSDGRVTSEGNPGHAVGSSEGATIKTSHLNLDSSGAYAVASHTADRSHALFENVSYTLRTDEHGDPVWIVTLHARSGQPVGTIFIGANRGTVTRTEGMFSGATMQDVETDQEQPPDNQGGLIGNARARVRATFFRARDEAQGMFERVRRSFDDFIDRVDPRSR
jgi:PKD repeat protein